MNKKLPTILKAALISSVISLSFVGSSFAQQSSEQSVDSSGLQVTSPIYEYTIKPGSVQQDIIKIKNVGTKAQTFYPEVRDFKPLDETGTPDFLKVGEDSGTYSLAKWISFTKEGVTLAPNESQAFNFNITVPATAEPGGHYGGILFSTQPPDVKSTGIGIASKVGSLVLVRIAGASREVLSIKEFSTPKNSYDNADVNFNLRLENTGNVHLQPKGVVTIKNFWGGQVAALDVNQLASNVIPGSIRKFDISWKDPGFKVGYYTASVVLNYGNPSQTVTSQTSFWILPWKTLLIALVILVVTIILLTLGVKKYNRWIITRAQKNPQ